MKNCNQCKREFPKNTDYYFKNKGTKDGFTARCKECQGSAFSNHLTKLPPKNGNKFCIKCDREFPINNRYFPEDKLCKDGLRNVCRECGKDGHFMEEGYVPKKWWTELEDRFFIIIYPHYTSQELVLLFYPECIEKDLWDKAYRLGGIIKTEETVNRANIQRSVKSSGEYSVNYGVPKTQEIRDKISIAKKGKYLGVNNYWFGKKRSEKQRIQIGNRVRLEGKWKGNKNPRHIKPLNGELNGRWEGGITAESQRIRNSEEYKSWRLSVFIRDGFTCQCCGNLRGKLEAHHIKNFSSNIDSRFDVGNGMTMCKECHNPNEYYSFHYIYGTKDNDKDQIEEYILRYKNGEFKEVS